MFPRLAIILSAALTLSAQEPVLTAAEKNFAESLNNVTLSGYYTRGDGSELKQDKYVIEKISKANGNLWKFEVRIQYNGKDLAVSLPIPIVWAGDTPVVSLTNFVVPGSGTFTARVLFYDGNYVGTWAAVDGHGGKLFGTIKKNPPPAAKP
ncbi:MAG: hypothetical protein HYX27_12740 [Acidobacteria bacterium]|nr:hypothetical protein [Acidobacteriota bacterium]